ncbi:MAG: ATP-binding protein, partial [Myxococcota bacterium]
AADEIDVPGALSLLKHQHPGLDIHLDVTKGLKIDEIEIAEALVRSTQEAITNALKHGRAKTIWIELGQNERGVTLSVRDDGEGGAPGAGGHGLQGMSERAGLLGGALEVDRSAGRGWTLRLFFPSEVTA